MGKIWTVLGLAVQRGQDREFWRKKRKETRQKGVKLSQNRVVLGVRRVPGEKDYTLDSEFICETEMRCDY